LLILIKSISIKVNKPYMTNSHKGLEILDVLEVGEDAEDTDGTEDGGIEQRLSESWAPAMHPIRTLA
jgi:hypothetical protein